MCQKLRAKAVLDWLAGLADNFVITRLATNLNGGLRHYNDRSVSTTARLLAVPTVTVQHPDWISTDLAGESLSPRSSR